MKNFICVALIVAVLRQGSALQCWRCSSDIIRTCNDPFNTSDILALRSGGSVYSNLQQNYNQQQRQYDPNYNSNYNPNYNPNYNRNYNPNLSPNNYGNRDLPILENCDENEARIRRMRPVCMKEILRGSSYTSVIRRCSLIPLEQYVGSCQRPTDRGLSLDFCETCEYDGCNSATGLKMNILFALLSVFITLSFFHHR